MTTKVDEVVKRNTKELLAAAERVAELGALLASHNQQVRDELRAAQAVRASVEDIAGELLKAQAHLVRALVEEQAGIEKAVIAAVQGAIKKSRSRVQWEVREAQEVLNRFEFTLAFSGATHEMQEIEEKVDQRHTAYQRLTVELDGLVRAIRHSAKD